MKINKILTINIIGGLLFIAAFLFGGWFKFLVFSSFICNNITILMIIEGKRIEKLEKLKGLQKLNEIIDFKEREIKRNYLHNE